MINDCLASNLKKHMVTMCALFTIQIIINRINCQACNDGSVIYHSIKTIINNLNFSELKINIGVDIVANIIIFNLYIRYCYLYFLKFNSPKLFLFIFVFYPFLFFGIVDFDGFLTLLNIANKETLNIYSVLLWIADYLLFCIPLLIIYFKKNKYPD